MIYVGESTDANTSATILPGANRLTKLSTAARLVTAPEIRPEEDRCAKGADVAHGPAISVVGEGDLIDDGLACQW
jgi:hypothetical protein